MPERTKLTEKVIREAEPIVGRDYQIFDTDVRGFAACIYRGGGRAFTLDYRHAGRQRRMGAFVCRQINHFSSSVQMRLVRRITPAPHTKAR